MRIDDESDFFVLFVVLLSACNELALFKNSAESKLNVASSSERLDNISDDSKNAEQNLVASKKIKSPSDVVFETVKMDYTPPKKIMDVCVDSDTHVENVINCPTAQIELAKSMPDFIAYTVNEYFTGDNNPKLLKFRRNLDEFFEEQLQRGGFYGYEQQVEIRRFA